MRRKTLAVIFIFTIAYMSFSTSGALAGTKKKAAPVASPAPEQDVTSKNFSKDASKDERYENLSLFQKVLFFVEQNYVENVKNKDLIYGAIKGMVETLDPHSNFLPPEIFRDMKIDTSGKFGGVGLEIGVKNSVLTVVTPIDDTPAYRAGLKAGDRVLKINGESTKGMNLVEAVARMRGKKGSDVYLTIWREGEGKPKEFKLTRAEIKIKTVKTEVLDTGYLYVRLTNFNERSSEDIRTAMEKYSKEHGKIKGLVLDLRNNPGGLLDQAVDVTSLFVDEGIVVSTAGRDTEKKDIRYAKKGMAYKDFPVAVVVNGASASASEIVAGALQDHKRALILGQPTFGKGSVQTVVELAPDVGLKLTIARYYTPNGRSIQLKGIEPDVFLDDFDKNILAEAAKKKNDVIRERDLRNHMSNEASEELKDLSTDEYIAQQEEKEKKSGKKDTHLDEETKPFIAKEDYQVKEALNYIKSYQTFKGSEKADASNAASQKKL